MTLFKSTGRLRYGNDYRLVLDVDQELSDYYRSLIPKCKNAKRTRWFAHVTLVRLGQEVPRNKSVWNKYNREKIDFYYDPYIHEDRIYFWLNVFSKRLEEIRRELGLPMFTSYPPPTGFVKSFHITIANTKE